MKNNNNDFGEFFGFVLWVDDFFEAFHDTRGAFLHNDRLSQIQAFYSWTKLMKPFPKEFYTNKYIASFLQKFGDYEKKLRKDKKTDERFRAFEGILRNKLKQNGNN